MGHIIEEKQNRKENVMVHAWENSKESIIWFCTKRI